MDKVMTTLTPEYQNKINILDETMQFSENFKRETLINKIATFEISSFKIEPKSETTLKPSVHGKKSLNTSGNFDDDDDDEETLDNFIAMIAKREKKGKGKGKYEGQLPFKCFSCNKIGHFASKCPTRVKKFKNDYKPKYAKECYYARDGVSDEESVEEEIGFISLEDEKNSQELALISQANIRVDWIIDSSCSHHMT